MKITALPITQMLKNDIFRKGVETLGGVLFASFSFSSKQEIIKRLGENCLKCGRSPDEADGGISFHHYIPQFFLKAMGMDWDDPKYGVPLCRHPCHDEEDRRIIPEYEKALQGSRNR